MVELNWLRTASCDGTTWPS